LLFEQKKKKITPIMAHSPPTCPKIATVTVFAVTVNEFEKHKELGRWVL